MNRPLDRKYSMIAQDAAERVDVPDGIQADPAEVRAVVSPKRSAA
jgi:hypothetical protein